MNKDLETFNNLIEQALKEKEELEKELEQVSNDYQDLGNKCYKWKQALEIIINKRVDVDLLLSSFSLKYYNEQIYEEKLGEKQLTQEEYDLLKEVLL